MGVGTIGDNGNDVRMRGHEQSHRCAHREAMNDDFAWQRLWLPTRHKDRSFQIAHLRFPAAGRDAIALAVPAKVEGKDVVATLILQRGSLAQVCSGDAVPMTEHNRGGLLRLRPEIASEERIVNGLKKQRTLPL